MHEYDRLAFLDDGFLMLLNESASTMWTFLVQCIYDLEVIAKPVMQFPEWLLSLCIMLVSERIEASTWPLWTNGDLVAWRSQ